MHHATAHSTNVLAADPRPGAQGPEFEGYRQYQIAYIIKSKGAVRPASPPCALSFHVKMFNVCTWVRVIMWRILSTGVWKWRGTTGTSYAWRARCRCAMVVCSCDYVASYLIYCHLRWISDLRKTVRSRNYAWFYSGSCACCIMDENVLTPQWILRLCTMDENIYPTVRSGTVLCRTRILQYVVQYSYYKHPTLLIEFYGIKPT